MSKRQETIEITAYLKYSWSDRTKKGISKLEERSEEIIQNTTHGNKYKETAKQKSTIVGNRLRQC